ncbi:MAG TPA: hypothetical protein VGG03_08270 [Thermoanaerobaculia bacterium]
MARRLTFKRLPPLEKEDLLADLVLDSESFDSFGPAAFGLKNLDRESRVRDVLVACFDLEGFTRFSESPNPQLFVPHFVKQFLDWLFLAIKTAVLEEPAERTVTQKGKSRTVKRLYGPLPFLGKYTGDGMLLLFEVNGPDVRQFCKKMRRAVEPEVQGDIWNTISALYDVCYKRYPNEFVSSVRKEYSKIPGRLRCGIATGQVCSIGREVDFVGPCINMASRLQKFNGLGFCVHKKGIWDKKNPSDKLADLFVTKKAEIRGIGEELLLVLREEFEKLNAEDQKSFKEP